ncbi:MAG: hypothetical protein JJ855_05785 [Rhodospirillales bacterium]|nr:hypothetical protein [Rhodospirillales bacterium]
MLYSLSSIPEDKLAALQAIEQEIGQPLLAFTEVKAEPARLDRDKLAKIRDLEDSLGVVLVAVKS